MKQKKLSYIFQNFNRIILFVLFLFLINFQNLFGQVEIKERVKIQPRTSLQKGYNRITSEHTIEFRMTWDLPEREGLIHAYGEPINSSTQGEGWITGGSSVLSSKFTKYGSYNFQFKVSLYKNEETIVKWEILIDGEIFKKGSNKLIGLWISIPYVNIDCYLPFYTDMSFQVKFLSGLNAGSINYRLEHYYGQDIIGRIENKYPIISIENGNDYLIFRDTYNDMSIGHSFYAGDYSINEFPKLISNNPYYSEETLFVRIKAEVEGVVKYDTVGVTRSYDFEIDVQTIPSRIGPDDSADFYLRKINFDGQKTEFPPDQLFNVEIVEGADYGMLISPQGSIGTSFSQIEQGFYFISNKVIDLDSVEVFIKVTTEINDDGVPTSVIKDSLYTTTENLTNSSSPKNKNKISNSAIPRIDDTMVGTREIAGFGSVIIQDVVVPQGIIVEFSKNKLSPGESADINLFMKGPEGEKLAFPDGDDQEFYLEIFENMEYADITLLNDSNGYDFVGNEKRPFKIRANENIILDSLRVWLYVETTDGTNSVPKISEKGKPKEQKVDIKSGIQLADRHESKRRNKQRGKGKKKKSNNVDNSTDISVPSTQGEILWAEASIDIMKANGCEEEIVECDNYELQKIDSTNFEVLGTNQNWSWIDIDGNLRATNTGDYCSKIQSNYEDKTIYGVTSALGSIGNNADGLSIYKTFSDIDVDVCLDENKDWNFLVDNLRFPIITSACPDYAESKGEIDLEDGNNYGLLEQHITDCIEFSIVMDWLNLYWIPGVYSATPYYDDTKYFFSHGTIAHENEHVKKLKISIIEEINSKDGLQMLQTNEYKLPKSVFPCPENAIEDKEDAIINLLTDQLIEGGNLYNKYGLREGTNQYEVELEADELSRSVRIKIKQNIKNWARNQTWWDDNNTFCTSEL
jgi:hypothetical protein